MSGFRGKLITASSMIATTLLAYWTMLLFDAHDSLFPNVAILTLAANVWGTPTYFRRIAAVRSDLGGSAARVLKKNFFWDDLLTILAAVSIVFFVVCTISLINSRNASDLAQQAILSSAAIGLGAYVIWALVYFRKLAWPLATDGGSRGGRATD